MSGLEEGARSIFKNVVVQRCIVHMIRNSVKYVPSKHYKRFTGQLKKVYGAASLKATAAEFQRFKQGCSQYSGAVDVWVRDWQHVAQLYNYGSAVRKVMYTTNAIEAVNSSCRKVTKKGSFPGEERLLGRSCIYALQSCTGNGTGVRYQTRQWFVTSCQWMKNPDADYEI